MIPDHYFDEGLNGSLYRNDMKQVNTVKMVYEKTQADYEQEQRDMLSSQDGDTCETHDQFYRDHKLLLVLFRVLAVMPITRSRPGTVTFSWKSRATMYAISFYIVATVVVLMVGYERVMILRSIKKFDDYIYAILFVAFLVPHFWIPFVGWGVAHQVAIYKTSWGKFQVRYYRVTGENLQFPNLQTQIVIISVGCLLLAICFLLSLCALMDGFLLIHTTAYYHIITMINMNCALWYINCKGIKIASQSLSECFRRDVNVEISAKLISRYRFLWLNLSELLQSLGNAYARTYSTYCLFMFFNITIAVYGALSEIVDHGFGFSFKEMGLFVDAAYCSTLLFIFVDCSHKSTLKVAAGVQDTLLGIDMLAVDRPAQKEIDHFIQAIEMNPAVVSLKGYAHVNRELLTSAISMIAIYLIVLLQFKISLPKTDT
ncbi:gustatory and odorant receptor 22-like isoform X1 [Leguminivora glycinivorella]|uniref:gustatory and odorant receptor 22-like isoform X1 n=1 Tax=Leguminivora glycinivorella TaxID=1035111 RepID=UPI00200F7070|nr:gustatory and odorant receptor 22-like isoform X1 [Leguminivora glycinivorella]